jgi:predicted transcriptional regulator
MQLGLPEISEIRRNLKSLKVSQVALAKHSGVPQSVISRIMSGEIKDPSYMTVRKLFTALDRLKLMQTGQEELTAAKMMSDKIFSVRSYQRLKDAWSIMKAHDFSQIPVLDESNRVVGSISESFLALHATEYDMEKRIDDFDIEDPFPMVGKNTTMSMLVDILRTSRAVLVVEKGKAVGIITRYDLIERR